MRLCGQKVVILCVLFSASKTEDPYNMSDSSLIHQQTDTESLRRQYFSGVDRAALQTNLLTSSILRDSNSSDTSSLSSVEEHTAPTYLYHKVKENSTSPISRKCTFAETFFQFFYLYRKHKLNCPYH